MSSFPKTEHNFSVGVKPMVPSVDNTTITPSASQVKVALPK